MKHTPAPIISIIRMLVLLLGMAFTAAYADDYSDVSHLLLAGKLSEALTRADQYLATQPKNPQMRFIKGVIQRDSGNSAESVSTFTRLTEDYPEMPEPYNNLAVLYAGQGQFDKARAALEMAIRNNPSYSTAHENLGDIYAKLASKAYSRALQLDTGNATVPTKLALILEIFNKGSSNSSHSGSVTEHVAPSDTPSVKPPVVAIVTEVPLMPTASVQPEPDVPRPTRPLVCDPPLTQTPTMPVATQGPVKISALFANFGASSVHGKEQVATLSSQNSALTGKN